MRRFTVHSPFAPAGDQPQAIRELVDGINSGLLSQVLLGVTGSGKTFTIAHVIGEIQRPTIVLAPNKTLAAQLYGEFREAFPDNAVEYFVSYYDYYQPEAYVPSSDTYIEKDASVNEHIEQMRLSATKALLERSDAIVVATVSAIYGLGDPGLYLKMVLHIDRGDTIDQRHLLRRLAELQYQRNDIDFHRASYRVRGDVIDIFPAESDREAVRVELFDDQIEQISVFDPLTGEVLRQLPRVTIYPKTHYVTPRDTLLRALDFIELALAARLVALRAAAKLVEAQAHAAQLEGRMVQITQKAGVDGGRDGAGLRASSGGPPHARGGALTGGATGAPCTCEDTVLLLDPATGQIIAQATLNEPRLVAADDQAVWVGFAPVSYTHLTLPTSDLSVDLGGRRIIKKKTTCDNSG